MTNYEYFKKKNKKFWMWFNMLVAFFSLGFMVGTYFVLDMAEADCAMMDFMLWMTIIFHFINLLVAFMNLAGCEKAVCELPNVLCVFIIFEITILVWM